MVKSNYGTSAIFCFIGFVSLLLFGASPAFPQTAQETPEACKELPPLTDFYVINEIKGRLQNEIPILAAKVKDLSDVKIPAAKAKSAFVEPDRKTQSPGAVNNKIDAAQNEQLSSSQNLIEDLAGGKTIEQYEANLEQAEDDLSWKRRQLDCVNAAMNDYTSKHEVTPEQSFKKTMSLWFAALIGLVIVGFFTLAIIDETVRRAVFSGSVGLQFLALFSIVIAIILFGITTILEAKELAALLGSLSGYILGRTMEASSRNDANGSGAGSAGGNFAAASIKVAPAAAILTAAAPTLTLTAQLLDAQNNAPADSQNFAPQWQSSDAAVATVDQTGLITRVTVGNCSVTATLNGIVSNACTIVCQ